MSKRILVVDDEESVVFLLSEHLARLGKEYKVEIACSGEEALALMAAQPFDLLITDLRMPGVDGLELLEQVRVRYPETRLILMTAYGSDEVEAEARRLEVYRYITKPFEVKELLKVARQALSKIEGSKRDVLILSSERFEAITHCLSDLRVKTNAQCVFLITTEGQPVSVDGLIDRLDVATLSALVAGNFLANHEIARLLGQKSIFKLSYHESDEHNIYSYSVEDRYLLVIVFGHDTKPGLVWFYARQAVDELSDILARSRAEGQAHEMLDADFSFSLSQQLDDLFDDI